MGSQEVAWSLSRERGIFISLASRGNKYSPFSTHDGWVAIIDMKFAVVNGFILVDA